MKIKYMTRFHGTSMACISEVSIYGETYKQVIFPDASRANKKSGYSNYFDSWEDAHNYLVNKAEESLESAKELVSKAEKNLNKIKEMINEQ